MNSDTDRALAQSQILGPSIALIVAAIIGMVVQFATVAVHLLGAGIGAATARGGTDAMAQMLSGGVGVVFGVIGIVMGVVILMGALKMKKLESFGFSMTAAILAMIPCVSPCCVIGLPVGIWALVVLNSPAVKSSFAR
jgi:hypothetical protein